MLRRTCSLASRSILRRAAENVHSVGGAPRTRARKLNALGRPAGRRSGRSESVNLAGGALLRLSIFVSNIGGITMHKYLLALSATMALAAGHALADERDGGVPALDHVFVLVLENHNAFTSFGSQGILDNPAAPHINALSKQYNFASNYNAVWHPSLPNYLAMITGDWIGTDVVGAPHSYPVGSIVGISDDDSPSVATDYPAPPANASIHRWKVQLPSLAGQLVSHGKDWRAYLQNLPANGTSP